MPNLYPLASSFQQAPAAINCFCLQQLLARGLSPKRLMVSLPLTGWKSQGIIPIPWKHLSTWRELVGKWATCLFSQQCPTLSPISPHMIELQLPTAVTDLMTHLSPVSFLFVFLRSSLPSFPTGVSWGHLLNNLPLNLYFKFCFWGTQTKT